jgi:aerobic carbon-monoxide dehydrogenase medium subunit
MKPPAFRYFDPRSVPEAVACLQEHGSGARILAGGQSLLPLMNLRLVRPAVLVDINRIAALTYIRETDGRLALGALSRLHAVEGSDTVRRRAPLLAEAAARVGHLAIRHRGTIGGNLAHADPASEIPAALLALEAQVVATGPRGDRTLSVADFLQGPLSTALDANEVLTEIRVPVEPPGSGSAFVEMSRREGDFALVGVAVFLQRDGGRCRRARIALCGVGGTALRMPDAEGLLAGSGLTDDALRTAARAIQGAVAPSDDVQASVEYRRHVAGVLTVRAVRQAWERAGQGKR